MSDPDRRKKKMAARAHREHNSRGVKLENNEEKHPQYKMGSGEDEAENIEEKSHGDYNDGVQPILDVFSERGVSQNLLKAHSEPLVTKAHCEPLETNFLQHSSRGLKLENNEDESHENETESNEDNEDESHENETEKAHCEPLVTKAHCEPLETNFLQHSSRGLKLENNEDENHENETESNEDNEDESHENETESNEGKSHEHMGHSKDKVDFQIEISSEFWVSQIKNRFHNNEYKLRQPSSGVCIYRVPETIRVLKPKAYVPLVSSFGPYHRHKKDEQHSALDDYKLEAVQRILKRFHGVDISNLIAEVDKLENKIRSCYEDSAIEYGKEALAWMFTMDACFILEFFWTLQKEMVKEEDHISIYFQYNGHQNILRWEVMSDIIKLENQIPLFILIRILKLGLGRKKAAVSTLVELVAPLRQFSGFPFTLVLSEDILRSRLKKHIQDGASHLLDLSRRMIIDFLKGSSSHSSRNAGMDRAKCAFPCYTLDFTPLCNTPSDDDSTPSAEKLNSAGIKFKQADERNIRFESRCFGSTFYIPQITIDDDTEILLRNLIAFEECQGCRLTRELTRISSFIHLMDDLIDTPEDVGLLKKDKVIKSLVGSDKEVADMINDLSKGITYVDNDQYKEVIQEVRMHYNSLLKVWTSQFIEEKCSKPWYVVALVAAVFVLGMTVVQTIFTVRN